MINCRQRFTGNFMPLIFMFLPTARCSSNAAAWFSTC